MTTTEFKMPCLSPVPYFRKACIEAIGDGSSDVIIELDRPSLGRDTMRLVRSKGPRGNVLCQGRTYKHTLVLFQVDMILSWLDGKGSKVWGEPDEEKTNAP